MAPLVVTHRRSMTKAEGERPVDRLVGGRATDGRVHARWRRTPGRPVGRSRRRPESLLGSDFPSAIGGEQASVPHVVAEPALAHRAGRPRVEWVQRVVGGAPGPDDPVGRVRDRGIGRPRGHLNCGRGSGLGQLFDSFKSVLFERGFPRVTVQRPDESPSRVHVRGSRVNQRSLSTTSLDQVVQAGSARRPDE